MNTTFAQFAAESRALLQRAAAKGILPDYKAPEPPSAKRSTNHVRKRIAHRHRTKNTLPKPRSKGPRGIFIQGIKHLDENGPYWVEWWISEEEYKKRFGNRLPEKQRFEKRWQESKSRKILDWLLSLPKYQEIDSPFPYGMTAHVVYEAKAKSQGTWRIIANKKANTCKVTRRK